MTRVEKFRRYREEIANMKVEDFSEKKLTAKKVSKIRESKSLTYHDIADVYQLDESKHSSLGFRLSKDQILYLVVAFATITLLVVFLILTK